MLNCINNQLNKLSSPKKADNLKVLNLDNNNFNQDLSFLSGAVNLDLLSLSRNKFHGSLEYLKEMKKLRILYIEDTDIDSGLEFLPKSTEYFSCLTKERKDAKCQTIYNLFANEQGEVETGITGIKNFPQKLMNYKLKIRVQQTGQILQLINSSPKKKEW